ncbi:TPA: type III secretion apparatus protein OrgA/MxiK [Enterobacter hormaechei]
MDKLSLTDALQRVLFDPLSYLHPQRVQIPASLTASSAARAAVNELLIRTYRLEIRCADLSPLARQWVRHWGHLPHTAYLIGCHTLRAELAWGGESLNLSAWVHPFTAIELPATRPAGRHVTSHDMLLKTGYSRLQAWASQLPEPLAQRFPLLFPSDIDTAALQPAADPLILTLALQHAQRYPNIPPVSSC